MAFVLFPALCLLSGANTQEWGVRVTPGPLSGWVGSCVTLDCSFSYPAGQNVTAVSWTLDISQTVYRSDNNPIDAAFKGRVRYLGDLRNNCSLQLARLRPSNQGTYRFQIETVSDGERKVWTSEPGEQLTVSASPCQPLLGSRMNPGPSLACSVGDACPHRPSWYDADGARWSPGQTPARQNATELPISPSRLPPGVALRCQVDGYRDGCGYDQPQLPGPVAPNVPSVEVLWPSGKTAIKAGDGFTLHCQAGALGSVAGYVWSRGDVWLPGAGQDFRIDKADVSDAGSYSCGVWVSGPGWAYLSLSARESVEVQVTHDVQPRMSTIGAAVAFLLLLLGLAVVIVWRKRWSKRQGTDSNASQTGLRETPMSDGIYENTQHYGGGGRPVWAHPGAELSCRPEADGTYEELQRPSQDIYSELDYPGAGSR